MTLLRCTDCRRAVRLQPVQDDDGKVYGPTCGKKRGLSPRRSARLPQWARPRPLDLPAVENFDGQLTLPLFDDEEGEDVG